MRARGGGIRDREDQEQTRSIRAPSWHRPLVVRALVQLLTALVAIAGCGSEPAPAATVTSPKDVGTPADTSGVGFEVGVSDVTTLDIPSSDIDDGPCGAPPPCDPSAVQLGFGCPCQGHADCASGLCLETSNGLVCSEACEECCPTGFVCREQIVVGADKRFVCQDPHVRLCDPCTENVQCDDATPGGDYCVELPGDDGAGGTFCATACDDDGSCPDGYDCREVTSVDGSASLQCVPTSENCACSPSAVEKKLETTCAIVNDFGRCEGQRVCTASGPSPCDAETPTAEVCNGLDDDCDLQLDEATCGPGQSCKDEGDGFECVCDGGKTLCGGACVDTASSLLHCGACDSPCDAPGVAAWGCVSSTCAVLTCEGGFEDLDGDADTGCECAVTEEVCDGIDNDCDSLTDESVDSTCGDDDPCTSDERCESGECTSTPVSGGPCDDGAVCTHLDTCVDGLCKGESLVCPDLPCQVGTCTEAAGGCTSTPVGDGAPCDDGKACTADDRCALGSCESTTGSACVGGGPCASWTCGAAGECVLAASAGPCDDGDSCTQGDLCVGTTCKGSTIDCNDQKPCTIDACSSALGCVHTPAQGSCDDGFVCTENDRCDVVTGACAGTSLDCDDGNPCTTDPPCSEAGERCANKPTLGVTACEDGTLCTKGEVCQNGVCGGGVLVDCDDENPCTDDLCLPAVGCSHSNNTATCDDDDACTSGETCSGGICGGGKSTDCPVSGPCIASATCNPSTGLCVPSAKPDGVGCSDGAACTTNDACLGGHCVGAPLDCGPAGPCEVSRSCEPASGTCKPTLRPDAETCSDGDACTTLDRCTSGVCTPGTEPLDCDDENPCTTDSCSPGSGCIHTPNQLPCDDDNPCTLVDACAQGGCVGSSPMVCTAGACQLTSTCVPEVGACVPTARPDGTGCDDGSSCTVTDVCVSGQCSAGSSRVCNDGNPCTTDGCEPLTPGGCVSAPASGPCSDGNPCTEADQCVGSTCVAGQVNGACCLTDAECEAKDPDRCDGTLACVNLTCVPKPNTAVTCDTASDDDCMKARCVPATGACEPTAEPDDKPCDDGDACSLLDACASGVCTSSLDVACAAQDDCHLVGVCDPATGVCSNPPATDGKACVDGDACTPNDQCVAGQCRGGERKTCPAISVCHLTGVCNAVTGACSTPQRPSGTPCDDGLACTDGASCQAGACLGGLSCIARGEACGDGRCFEVGVLEAGASWLGDLSGLLDRVVLAGTWLSGQATATGRVLQLGALLEVFR
jgi:hypothetical protein